MSRNSYVPLLSFLVGALLLGAVSVWATDIGNSVSATSGVSVATSTASAPLAINGNVFLDSRLIRFASSSAETLTFSYAKAATSTIPQVTNALAVSTSTAAAAKAFFSLDALNGRVGIGTPNPSEELHISGGGSAFTRLEVESIGTAGRAGIHLKTGANEFIIETQGGYSPLLFWNEAASAYVVEIGTVGLRVLDGSASTPSYTYINDLNTGVFRAGADTLGFTTGGEERMRLDSSGNLGIGTTSPASRLSIQSSATTATTTVYLGTGGSTTNGSCVQMHSPNGTAYRLYVSNAGTLTTQAGTCE